MPVQVQLNKIELCLKFSELNRLCSIDFMLISQIISFMFVVSKMKCAQDGLKVGLSPSEKIICISMKVLKNDKNIFYFMLKALFVPEIFTFLSWLFGYVEKRLDKKAMVNFKIYDVIDWTTSYYNTHNVIYLKKLRQPNKILSVNRIQHGKCFFLKTIHRL